MANNRIQIKRSSTTIANTSSPTLANGEFAFTQNGSSLWIGLPDGTANMRVGGQMVPGTLTANQALVANATSGIDKVIVANLVPTQVYANGSLGTGGWVLASGAAGNAYWINPSTFSTSAVGANTQIEFNDSGAFGADANLTFDKSTVKFTVNGTISAGSGTSNSVVNTSVFTIQTPTTSANLSASGLTVGIAVHNASAMAVGSNVVQNASAFSISGNTTTAPTTTLSGTSLQIGNNSITGAPQIVLSNTAGTTTINTNSVATTSITGNLTGNVVATTISGNLTGNVSATTISGNLTGNVSATTLSASANVTVGANTLVNTSAFYIAGNTTTAPSMTLIGTGLTIGNTSIIGAPQIVLANSAGNTTINTTSIAITNSTPYTFFSANTSRIAIGNAVAIVANGGIGTASQVLASNGTGVYWADNANGTVTSIATGNGVTGGTITGSGTISVVANNGIVANTSGLFAKAANGISVDSSGINVVGSNGITSNTSGLFLATGSTLTNNTSGLFVNTTLSIQDLTLAGNLTINGTLTTVESTNLQVKDGLIKLADQNTTTDTIDVGFYGQFGNATITQYTGLFRKASDGVYRLFTGLQAEPTTTVNVAGTGYALANLQLGALTLTNPLLTTSGGVGVNTYAKGDILIAGAINPTSLTQLNIGTDGYVLQANSTTGLPVWGTLDGGVF